MELHLPPAKEHEIVISTMETVFDILFCSNMTGRSTTVESLQNFLMKFWFAITDKSSCWLHRMINVSLEMILESETGYFSQAQGSDGPIVFLILLLQLGKPSISLLSFPLSSDLPIPQHPTDPCSSETAFPRVCCRASHCLCWPLLALPRSPLLHLWSYFSGKALLLLVYKFLSLSESPP